MSHAQPDTFFGNQPATGSKSRPTRKPLTGQILRVYDALRQSSKWLTIPELQVQTGDAGNSISAQIRNLRKEEYGSHNVVGRRRSGTAGGLWEYRLFESDGDQSPEAA